MALSSDEEQATATNNMYSKCRETWTRGLRYASEKTARHADRQTDRYIRAHRSTSPFYHGGGVRYFIFELVD